MLVWTVFCMEACWWSWGSVLVELAERGNEDNVRVMCKMRCSRD